MVASSEQQSAPVMVITPAIVQASSNHPGAPLNRADSAEVMKIPDPIIEPTTIMVASNKPRPRLSFRLSFANPAGFDITVQRARAQIRISNLEIRNKFQLRKEVIVKTKAAGSRGFPYFSLLVIRICFEFRDPSFGFLRFD